MEVRMLTSLGQVAPISHSLEVTPIMSTPQYEKPAPMTYVAGQRADERR